MLRRAKLLTPVSLRITLLYLAISVPLPCQATQHNGAVIDDFICRNKRNGANVDPTSLDCSTYSICQNGKLQGQKRCINDALFNGESCVPALLYKCPANAQRSYLVDSCRGKPNGLYGRPQYGCLSYIRCQSEVLIETKNCPNGHFFDMESARCVYERVSDHRRCTDVGPSSDCAHKSVGLYSDAGCNSFYYCYKGSKVQYQCSNGKVFNGASCVAKHKYTCPATDSADTFCRNRADGYYKDTRDGCRSYHFCSKGLKITYLCSEGYVFDTLDEKCTRPDNFSMTMCKSDQLCQGKPDGYYANLRNNCRNYYYCKNHERVTQITCRNNNVFNGQKCVSPLTYACPSLYNYRQINCMPRRCVHQCQTNGFFADLMTDCREYYFCIDGNPSLLSCTAGKRFNGELCVPDASYSCPAFCDDSNEQTDCPLGGYVVA